MAPAAARRIEIAPAEEDFLGVAQSISGRRWRMRPADERTVRERGQEMGLDDGHVADDRDHPDHRVDDDLADRLLLVEPSLDGPPDQERADRALDGHMGSERHLKKRAQDH